MTMTDPDRLILIRHAVPQIDPQTPAGLWQLGHEGRTAARALRPLLAQSAYYVASTEPKAIETLQEISGDPHMPTDPGFAEVRRPHRWSDEHDYRTVARAYVQGARHDGWESHEEVTDRFDAAVARHAALAAACNRTLIIGTHGLAPTIWLASRYFLRPGPAQFWAALRFPDIIDVDRTAGTVSRRPR
jgi:broad specificity phosphatase PhoE